MVDSLGKRPERRGKIRQLDSKKFEEFGMLCYRP